MTMLIEPMFQQANGGPLYRSDDGGLTWVSLEAAKWTSDYARFRPRFAAALDERYHPIEWVDGALYSGRMTGFFGRESALLAEIKDYPGGARVGSVFHALGDMDELENEIRPRAEAWAQANGCTEIQLDGRRGWIRRLKRYGYRHEKTTVAKEL